jgi:CRP-like cAMP-binding protein
MFVESGFLEIGGGADVVFDYLGPGDICGERCLQDGWEEVARALTDVTIASMPGACTAEVVCENQQLASMVLRNLIQRMIRYEASITNLVTEPTERRVAKLFLRFQSLAHRSGWTQIPNLTNPHIASIIGTTRWQVSRYINHLRELRIVRRDGGMWVDFDVLRAFLEQRTTNAP